MDISTVVTILCSVIASSGFWALIQGLINKKSAHTKMLIGLGHDRIVELCEKYIARGYITSDEYENLHDYLFVPYSKSGGNGSAARLMKEVDKLPVRKEHKNEAYE